MCLGGDCKGLSKLDLLNSNASISLSLLLSASSSCASHAFPDAERSLPYRWAPGSHAPLDVATDRLRCHSVSVARIAQRDRCSTGTTAGTSGSHRRLKSPKKWCGDAETTESIAGELWINHPAAPDRSGPSPPLAFLSFFSFFFATGRDESSARHRGAVGMWLCERESLHCIQQQLDYFKAQKVKSDKSVSVFIIIIIIITILIIIIIIKQRRCFRLTARSHRSSKQQQQPWRELCSWVPSRNPLVVERTCVSPRVFAKVYGIGGAHLPAVEESFFFFSKARLSAAPLPAPACFSTSSVAVVSPRALRIFLGTAWRFPLNRPLPDSVLLLRPYIPLQRTVGGGRGGGVGVLNQSYVWIGAVPVSMHLSHTAPERTSRFWELDMQRLTWKGWI